VPAFEHSVFQDPCPTGLKSKFFTEVDIQNLVRVRKVSSKTAQQWIVIAF